MPLPPPQGLWCLSREGKIRPADTSGYLTAARACKKGLAGGVAQLMAKALSARVRLLALEAL